MVSLVREDAPWLYEIGMNVYRAMLSGERPAVEAAHKQFLSTMEIMISGPWMRELMRDDEEMYILTRYLPELIERAIVEFMASSPIRRRSKILDVAADSGQP